jgi:hypothetical protein
MNTTKRTAACINDLACDPAAVRPCQERGNISDILGLPDAAQYG